MTQANKWARKPTHFDPTNKTLGPQKTMTRTRSTSGARNKDDVNLSGKFTDNVALGNFGKWAASCSTDGASLVYRWHNNSWQEFSMQQGETLIAEWLTKHYPEKRSARAVSDAWRFNEMSLRTSHPLPQKKPGEFIIPLQDNYLRVEKDGAISVVEPKPEYGMTYSIKCRAKTALGAYAPKPVPEDSLFYRFISKAQPDPEIRKMLQECCAMSLLPGRKSECLWNWGAAGAGKGELTELISYYHLRIGVIDLFKLNDSFHLEPCVGASLITCDEVERGKWKEGAFKSFITGNPLTIGRKGVKNINNYINEGYVIVSSNTQPFFTDTSNGVARRIVPIEWKNAIPEEDRIPQIARLIFENEANIVLDWLLEGVQRIVRRGGKIAPQAEWPESMRRFKEDLVVENNVVRKWARDQHIQPNINCWHSKDEVYAAYRAWAELDCATVLEGNVFWRMFWELPQFAPFKDQCKQKTVNGLRVRCVPLALSLEEFDQFDFGNGPSLELSEIPF